MAKLQRTLSVFLIVVTDSYAGAERWGGVEQLEGGRMCGIAGHRHLEN